MIVWWMALSAILPVLQYVFRAFRQSEGLKNRAINGLAEALEGFLWNATENRVFRFAGTEFQKFGREQGIEELDVQNIVAGPAGDSLDCHM